jgi:ribulose-phosphate 3-epimerase
MSVNPGFGGQKFINSSIDKIKSIRNLVGDRNIKIQVDGGINDKTSSKVIEAGADVLVAGSAIFKGTGLENYKKNIDVLRSKS